MVEQSNMRQWYTFCKSWESIELSSFLISSILYFGLFIYQVVQAFLAAFIFLFPMTLKRLHQLISSKIVFCKMKKWRSVQILYSKKYTLWRKSPLFATKIQEHKTSLNFHLRLHLFTSMVYTSSLQNFKLVKMNHLYCNRIYAVVSSWLNLLLEKGTLLHLWSMIAEGL